MTWDFDGHEGYAATIVAGGLEVVSYDGEGMKLEDGTCVADSETIGWRAQCTCGWKAPLTVDRVSDPTVSRKEGQVLDTEGGSAPSEVLKDCHTEWLDHVRPEGNLPAVRQAAQHYRNSGVALDSAVAEARNLGASWNDIGKAVGVTRQTAHERWKALSRSDD